MKDFVSGLLFAGFGLAVWLYAGTFPTMADGHPGPALFPRLIAMGLVLAGLGLAVQGARQGRKGAVGEGRQPWSPAGAGRLVLGLALVALVPLMQRQIGFVPAMALLSFAVALGLDVRPTVAVPVALGSVLVIYWTFTGLLGVPL